MAKKNKKEGQRHKTCEIVGCEEKGRILAILGNIDLAYCPHHRKKYGERIINALINSCFNYKLTSFLAETKNFQSTLTFKLIPFLLGFGNLIT